MILKVLGQWILSVTFGITIHTMAKAVLYADQFLLSNFHFRTRGKNRLISIYPNIYKNMNKLNENRIYSTSQFCLSHFLMLLYFFQHVEKLSCPH